MRHLKLLRTSLVFAFLFLIACKEYPRKNGEVVRIDYRNTEFTENDWIEIDSFRFEHIGEREDAKNVEYPLPSNEVFVDSIGGEQFARDYNPKVVPIYIAKHLDRINKKLPEDKKFIIEKGALLSYMGILEIIKEDSSNIQVTTSKGYDAEISVSSP